MSFNILKCSRCEIDSSYLYKLDGSGLIVTKHGLLCEVCYEVRNNLALSCCGGSGAANWDQSAQKWKCSDCGTIQSSDPTYIGNGFKGIVDDIEKELEKLYPAKKKCVCGGEKTKTTHAHWCDIKN